ncbi:lipoprotein [Borreliella japonica]|uniref:Lipoprotein n=1 Tax=Borreliella japonica TaxID=34095 RepID=A0A1G4Q685_BORJA|nr:CRASP family complement regulator-acquiring lipoprotein [Borreliella japonica]SCW39987.1 lipoprotein [Borreliella japonica]
MKNNIILCICVFLFFLNTCSSDYDAKKVIKKTINETKNIPIDETKNLIDLIVTTKATIDKNRTFPIEQKSIENTDGENNKKVFKMGKRAFDFINTFLTNDEIYKFATIFNKPALKSPAKVLNSITIVEFYLESIINHLFFKKDVLDKVKILDLKKIKNSLEQIFSIRKIFSNLIKQFLLDYQNNKNSIKTDDSKLKAYFDAILNKFNEKKIEVDNLKTSILATPIPNIMD